MLGFSLVVLLSASGFGLASLGEQGVLSPSHNVENAFTKYDVDQSIIAALATHPDPVDALIALQHGVADELREPRLLHVFGEERPQWMTEGDKLRLRRDKRKFMDITDHEEFYAHHADAAAFAGKAHLPNLTHHKLVKPLFAHVSTKRMHDVLKHFSSYYNRYYGDVIGARSAHWLHDHIAQIIADAPFGAHISLEYFTHPFPQSSIIARFEPKVRNFSQPLTILGAHQDSANYLFPLLPAPGADDDGSGTVSILEAFRVLAESGYTPLRGPVEFHWYAAEEGGLLGSQYIARFKKDQRAPIGAMMEFDATAYIAHNATESIGFIRTEADSALTDWAVNLSNEYISIPALVSALEGSAGSDYMSFTKFGYPSAYASEGDPMHGGFPGDMNPFFHTENDTMTLNTTHGYFSIDHMARFSELAIAFVIEQSGWDNAW
ncbi:hypothetical protein BX600DRAFT_500185 [Xylariales sp. PMI_506]|nr:hypothetical protein BX600DRAFT_500185 [Xylariales sp. PMI_506]